MWYADADVPERGPDDNPALALYLVPYSGQHPTSSAALMPSSVAALTLGCSCNVYLQYAPCHATFT